MRKLPLAASAALALFASTLQAGAPATVKDGEGNEYATVAIGDQTWLKQNLKATKYRNGDPIGTTDPIDKGIAAESEPKYQWPAKGTDSGAAVYGRLYTWHAATDDRGICPDGFEVPTDAQWKALTDHLGGLSVAGTKLKEAGSDHWQPLNTGDNSSGFTALGAGTRETSGSIGGLDAGFWTSTKMMSGYAYYRRLFGYKAEVTAPGQAMGVGYSVRCIRAAVAAGEPTGLRGGAQPAPTGFRILPGAELGAWQVEGGDAAAFEVRVVDVHGRIAAAGSSTGAGSARLDLSRARPGVYLARIRTASGTFARPFVLP